MAHAEIDLHVVSEKRDMQTYVCVELKVELCKSFTSCVFIF